jgi:hypothetical protein
MWKGEDLKMVTMPKLEQISWTRLGLYSPWQDLEQQWAKRSAIKLQNELQDVRYIFGRLRKRNLSSIIAAGISARHCTRTK